MCIRRLWLCLSLRSYSSTGDTAVIGYSQYRDLDKLMPLDVDDTVTSRWGVSLVLGSPVFSVVVSVNRRSDDRQVCTKSHHPMTQSFGAGSSYVNTIILCNLFHVWLSEVCGSLRFEVSGLFHSE